MSEWSSPARKKNIFFNDTATPENYTLSLHDALPISIAYNSISLVADGVSYPHRNVDIFSNDIFETSDDGIEPDYGYENIRVWGNRIHHAHHNGISFQPMNGGPWYVLRNQVVG